MTYRERLASNQRLIVLRALDGQNDGRLNENLLAGELDVFGHTLSRAEVRDLLRWLENAAAITIEFPGDAVMIAKITRRGEDHVQRRGEPIEGVDRPSRL